MAYYLLRATPGMKVSEVMRAAGLNDAKNFTAIFKERFGVTPRQGAPKSGK